MLVMILSMTLIGCSTTVIDSSDRVEIPKLDISVEKPVLVPIPPLNVSYMTSEQQNDLTAVLVAYNQNVSLLITYSNELLDMQQVIIDYYKNIISTYGK